MLRSDDDDRLSNALVTTGDTRRNQTEASVNSIHSTGSDDVTVVHPSTMPTANSSLPPPALPFRSKVDRRRVLLPKARASSPAAADVTDGKAERNCASLPPIPPRLPPRLSRSSDYNQRLPRRPVHAPRSPLVLLLSPANDLNLSGAELLQSRPPPPLPPRGVSSAGMTCPPSVAHQRRFPKSSEEVSLSSASDLVWWPSSSSREQQPLDSQLHQLSHWPITYADHHQPLSGSKRQMNDYVDSPIALHSNAQTANNDGLEVVLVDSESSDVSSDRRPSPAPPPSLPASSPSTKVKRGVRQRTVPQCQQRVICTRCGKCRCKQCNTVARPLPRCWAGECECGARSAVDCCTCMCCARALFYHCRTTEDEDFSDDPCACMEQSGCFRRWTLLTLLSLCLPCLCLYCPLVGAVRLCTACYNRRKNSRGCCCCEDERRRTEASKGLLLVESESSSS